MLIQFSPNDGPQHPPPLPLDLSVLQVKFELKIYNLQVAELNPIILTMCIFKTNNCAFFISNIDKAWQGMVSDEESGLLILFVHLVCNYVWYILMISEA